MAVATVILVAWLFSHVTGFRARAFLWGFTTAFGGVFIYGLFAPLAGIVTSVEQVITPWGEQMSVLRRDSVSPLLVPAYVWRCQCLASACSAHSGSGRATASAVC